MDRRSFLLGIAGAVGATAAAGALLSPAQATMLSQINDLMPEEGPGDSAADPVPGRAAPDGTPVEPIQWRPPGVYRRRRRRVCGWRRNRWGRPVRRCWYVWR